MISLSSLNFYYFRFNFIKKRKAVEFLKKFNEISEISLKNHKERVFYEQAQRRNLVKITGSRTPDVKTQHFLGLKEKVSDFSGYMQKVDKKKLILSKSSLEKNESSIEGVLKTLEIKENQRYLGISKGIVSFIVNNLNEIKPSDVILQIFYKFC